MKNREEVKKLLKDWLRATVRLTADKKRLDHGSGYTMNDIANDISIAFKVEYGIEMKESWVKRVMLGGNKT